MPVYKNMIREYSLGAGWSQVVKKNSDVYSIMIFEMGSDTRRLEFPLVRWSSFTRAFDEIDNAVNDFRPTTSSSTRTKSAVATTSP